MKSIFQIPRYEEPLRRLAGLRPESPRRWGRMTAHQAVCHLSDAFFLVMGERTTDFRADSLVNRTIGRLYALTLPLPWPRGVPTSPEADQEASGTPPGGFEGDVATLRPLMQRFRDTGVRGLGPHVALGSLTPGEWGRWGYRRMDHHLRQFGV